MDDRPKSFLTRIFECVNLGLECSAKQVRSSMPCPPRKRKTKNHTENEGSRDSDKIEKDTGIITVEKVEEADGEGRRKSSSLCPKLESQLLKEDICAEIASEPTCCFIKMQDPCAPCCCETSVPTKPCPPKGYHQEPREPTCGCELCKKSHMGGKCCGEMEKNGTDRNSEEHEPGRLRKA